MESVTQRPTELGRRLPVAGRLIGRIRDRKYRDNLVVTIVAALATCFVLWLAFG